MSGRIDMTEWVTHFIHEKKNRLITSEEYIDNLLFIPDYFDEQGNGISFEKDCYDDYPDFQLEDGASAFRVLKKILFDGYLQTGWSFRKGKPTLYGDRSAVCFSEMPLYSLVEYAKRRKYSGYVDHYGIAFKKAELYEMGARPVIYGITLPHKEVEAEENHTDYSPRILHPDLGIGRQEQYRYVYTCISDARRGDWTHEREWRWALDPRKVNFAGMPFLLEEEYCHGIIKDLIVIVRTKDEAEEIADLLKTLYDGVENKGRYYDLDLLQQIKIISLDALAVYMPYNKYPRIEDLPYQQLATIRKFTIKDALKEKVEQVYEKANKIYDQSKADYLAAHPDVDVCGFVHIVTYEITEITQAFIDLGLAKSYGDGVYHIYLESRSFTSTITAAEFAGEKAACYLTEALGQEFQMVSRLD